MATLSFMRLDFLQDVARWRQSVKPAAQFLQQVRRAPAQAGVGLAALDIEEALERGNGSTALVELHVELAGLEQEFRAVRRDRQHPLERSCRAAPVLALGEPETRVV